MTVLAAVGRAARFPGWHTHPDVWLLMGVLATGYWWATRDDRPGGRRAASFVAGLCVLWLASDWPVHDLAEGYLYSVHMVQHLLISLVAAPLLIVGTPAPVVRRLLHPIWPLVRWATRPLPALIQFNAVIVLSHWPVWVDLTLRHHGLHFVAHAILLVSGLVMWTPVFSPVAELVTLTPPARMLYLFLQSFVPTVPASFLTFGTTPLYHFYEHVPRLWGWSALSDQQVAGLIMKVGGGFYLWTVIGVIFFRWYQREEADTAVLTWDQVERELKQLGT